MANRHKAQAFKSGGGVKSAALSFGNTDVVKEARDTSCGPGVKANFKKNGGQVVGRKSGGRLDKRARGGKIGKFARGGSSPFSSASKVKG